MPERVWTSGAGEGVLCALLWEPAEEVPSGGDELGCGIGVEPWEVEE